ncbi:MAG: glycoside hydrolase family 5 protein [Phycisphaerae bacterium]|nr:glycoside hydrolase family 5 protein [Phycisphaerae bacterium]
MSFLRQAGLVAVLAVMVLSAAGPAFGAANDGDAFAVNRRLGRGVNIIGYDPIWRSREQGRFKAEYFAMLREAGFDTVRINLHAYRHMDAERGLALRDSWWEVLNWAVDHALAAKLMVILDLHEFGAMGTAPEANKEKFLSFWRQVSERFKDAPAEVVFELLNEPSRELTAEKWNGYLAEAMAIIRATNPTRTVILGPAGYNNINSLYQLKLPEDDRNIILTVHYYSPFDFTHQGASWAGKQDKIGVKWEGTDAEKSAVESDFAKAAAWAKEYKRPIFLGEFGVYDKAEMESRVRYLRFVTRTAEKMGWSWAYWQFDSDFILYDIPNEKWNEMVRDALLDR